MILQADSLDGFPLLDRNMEGSSGTHCRHIIVLAQDCHPFANRMQINPHLCRDGWQLAIQHSRATVSMRQEIQIQPDAGTQGVIMSGIGIGD